MCESRRRQRAAQRRVLPTSRVTPVPTKNVLTPKPGKVKLRKAGLTSPVTRDTSATTRMKERMEELRKHRRRAARRSQHDLYKLYDSWRIHYRHSMVPLTDDCQNRLGNY